MKIQTQEIYIGQAKDILGIKDQRTFRKWVKKGVIKPCGKNSLGWDLFDIKEMKQLAKKVNKEKGLPAFNN